MNILFITSRLPFPLDRGDRLVCYHRLRTLSQNHNITLIAFYQSHDELKHIDQFSKMCEKVYPIYLPKWKLFLNSLRFLFDWKTPFQVSCYTSRDFQLKIDSIIEREKIDLFHYFLIRTTGLKTPQDAPKVIDLIDSMQLNFFSRIDLEKSWKKIIFREELRRLYSYEKHILEEFDRGMVVSTKDAQYFSDHIDKVKIIPLGIDFNVFKPLNKIERSDDVHIIFSGNMGYAPNIHAVLWFCKNCWNGIIKECHNAKLFIAGSNPSKEILDLANHKEIIVTGRVVSMSETIANADIAIAPMQSGSGMQFKILEAMACGIPVITSSLGLGTINAINNKNIIVANTPIEFIENIISLIKDLPKRKMIGNGGLEFVSISHNWDVGGEKMKLIYDEVKRKHNFSS
jgi:polysaccharide biosynthesis protein PslH